MSLTNLNNLEKIGQLKKETFDLSEFNGLLHAGKARLHDAKNVDLTIESRFDLAYNASHSLALAALRWHGYRPENKNGHRYIVFQSIPLTTSLNNTVAKILTQCHNKRNIAEYEGHIEIEEQLVTELITTTEKLFEAVKSFSPGVKHG